VAAANAGTEFQANLQRIFVCPEEIAYSIARRARDRRYPVRSTIIRQGDQTVATFLLVAGRAQALTCGQDGHLVLLHEYQCGDVFGVAATDEPAIENADVVALEEVRAAVFLASDFIALLETHSCVAVLVSKALLRQLRAASLRVAERSTFVGERPRPRGIAPTRASLRRARHQVRAGVGGARSSYSLLA
jgi:CRP-like cAMP-binding protein